MGSVHPGGGIMAETRSIATPTDVSSLFAPDIPYKHYGPSSELCLCHGAVMSLKSSLETTNYLEIKYIHIIFIWFLKFPLQLTFVFVNLFPGFWKIEHHLKLFLIEVINFVKDFQTEVKHFTAHSTWNLGGFYLKLISNMIQVKYTVKLFIPSFALKAWHEDLPLNHLQLHLLFAPAKIKHNKTHPHSNKTTTNKNISHLWLNES